MRRDRDCKYVQGKKGSLFYEEKTGAAEGKEGGTRRGLHQNVRQPNANPFFSREEEASSLKKAPDARGGIIEGRILRRKFAEKKKGDTTSGLKLLAKEG